jgi:hypothetical protein
LFGFENLGIPCVKEICLLITADDQVVADRLDPALSSFGLSLVRCATSIPTTNPVLVVWSPMSRLAPEIVTLANQAHIEGRLIQIGWRNGTPPTEFAPDGFVDLSAWRGGKKNPRFETLLGAIDAVLAGRPVPAGAGNRERRTRTVRLIRFGATAGSVSLGLLGFLANIGGTRDFICSFPPVGATCVALGIQSQGDETNSALRDQITGDWGQPGCRRLGHFSFDGEELIQLWPMVDDLRATKSQSQVEGYGKNLLFVRDRQTGIKWTLTINGRHMSLMPEGGKAETPLVRCG